MSAPVSKIIVIFGDRGTGKSSITYALKHGKIIKKDVKPDEGINAPIHSMVFGDSQYDLELYEKNDTGFDMCLKYLFAEANAVLLFYAVDSEESLENVFKLWKPLADEYCKHSNIILVGNKRDLMKMSKAEVIAKGEEARLQLNASELLLCSSKNPKSIIKLFEAAINLPLKSPKGIFDGSSAE